MGSLSGGVCPGGRVSDQRVSFCLGVSVQGAGSLTKGVSGGPCPEGSLSPG